ncbi:MAG: hypothetical protein HYV07_26740 [Deltaproteobacteria bacterium]|nr:hypothetical protein [Deltaproteobacteria bacterium]
MTRRAERLPEGWDSEIPDEKWADAVPVAIRIDIRALGSRRVISTLARLRADLTGGDDARARAARLRLMEIGRALLGGSGDLAPFIAAEPGIDQTVAAWSADPPSADSVRARSAIDATIAPADMLPKPETSPRPRAVLRAKGKTGAAPEPPLARTSDLPANTIEAIRLLEAALDVEDAQRAVKSKSARAPDSSAEQEPATATYTLDAAISKAAPVHPPVSRAQVTTLYGGIAALCAELVPLSYERRQRRFWARWREVSGDRGVRRKVADELLRRCTDFVSLVSGLVTEVLDADPDAVREVVAQLSTSSPPPPPPRASEPAPPMPLVGASVPIDVPE